MDDTTVDRTATDRWAAPTGRPTSVAIANDYEVVVRGLAAMLEGDPRVRVDDLAAARRASSTVDVVLYDSFGHGPVRLTNLVADPVATRVVVYTWSFEDAAVDGALEQGACGYLSKELGRRELADAIVRIARGEVVVSDPPGLRHAGGGEWPGQGHGLSERESEVLAMITQGYSNAEIASALFLSINSIKTHIRKLYAKIGARDRSQALLWGIDHGFRPDRLQAPGRQSA